MQLEGTPSDQLPAVLATGTATAPYLFASFSAREPDGRDAEYIEWHSLDHRPEQYRLAELRNAIRIVSTPECRAVRAASEAEYDAVDHVMTYIFTGVEGIPGFMALGDALNAGGRMPLRLPSVGYMTADLAGKIAAGRAVAGEDVIPWRPARGVYLMIEKGHLSPASLIDHPGISGIWWYHGNISPKPFDADATGMQVTYCYLDEDPVEVGAALRDVMAERWQSGEATGLLAAAFQCIEPWAWDRFLP